MPVMIAKQKERDYDVVTGSRYISGGGVYGWNLQRKLTSRVANFIADTLLNPCVSDLTGSFRLFKREVFESIMKMMESKGYVFQMEVIVRAHQAALLDWRSADRVRGPYVREVEDGCD